MIVSELIEILQKANPDAEVIVEAFEIVESYKVVLVKDNKIIISLADILDFEDDI